MTNESEHDETIKALEAQLEAAKAKAKIEAMEAELTALKQKDAAASAAEQAAAEVRAADEAAAAKAAEEAARARAAEEASAAAEATQAAAAADRAAALQAELDALKAAAAAATPAVVAAPAQPVVPAQPAASTAHEAPRVVYVETPARPKRGGLVAALVVIVLATVATLGATFLAIRGDLRGPWAAPAASPTDVLLIGAGDFGPAPAKTDSGPLVTFDELSQPATAATPEAAATLASIQISGETPEIYGLSYVGCESLDSTDPANASVVAAFVAALNTDETLGTGRALTADDYIAYRQQWTFGHLLGDTRVTYNGYSAGATFPIQAVLQKGTLVAFDRFGIPRVHCGSSVALTSPAVAEGETIFSGAAWGDLDVNALVTLTPAPDAQSEFTVLPVGPSNVQTAFAVGPRLCAWSAKGSCPSPSELAVIDPPVIDPAVPAPTITECSNWAPGIGDADSVPARIVNATSATVQWFQIDSAQNGCLPRHDVALGSGENALIETTWPGTLVLFTDGQSATPIAEYVFGEKTLFVIQ